MDCAKCHSTFGHQENWMQKQNVTKSLNILVFIRYAPHNNNTMTVTSTGSCGNYQYKSSTQGQVGLVPRGLHTCTTRWKIPF